MENNIEEKILDLVLKNSDSAEVIYEEGESRSISFENNKLKSVYTKSIRGIGLRIIKDGKIGFSSTTDFRKPEQLVTNALESAAFGQEAKFEFPSKSQLKETRLFDENVVNYPIEKGIQIGKEAIEKVLSVNPDYECGVSIGKGFGKSRLINSSGLDISTRSTSFGTSMDILLVKNNGLLCVGEGESSAKVVDDLDKYTTIMLRDLRLAEKEVDVSTGSYPVVFTSKVIGTLLSTFETGCNGKMVQKGVSPLTGKLGEKIMDERISIYDDPTIDYADGSYMCDDEGVSARRTPLFESGVLKNYIYDLQTAGIMNAKSTGNGIRSFASQPSPGNSNVIVEPGDMKFEDMIKDMKSGILVDQVLGGGQSNVLAGEFSVNVDLGYLVENGEIVGRIKDCMIAGNVFEVFNDIIALGDRSDWHGSLKVPPFYFRSVNLVGKN
ncbi:MAG: TldD/PmbA family protein [Candidatus Scalindua rubra]|uniref:Peptidase n=1 Tax=Candidatus Scalindua brodae TaxID=237368 RepID=A0A0B0EGM9_9BACT|nr:MAG: peptidase [Candidatus Scalindua brodae]MBZ0109318.1 TldD/PmbA family protein [Candidatus Scalindua rubra]